MPAPTLHRNLEPLMKIFSIATLAISSAAALAFSAPAWAQATAKLNPAQSEIGFTAKQMGVPVEGKFKRFDAQILLDPKKPEAANVAFTVDLASVSMGAEADAELVKPEWFDVKKAAQATFQSTSVKAAGPGKFDVAGKLTIKGNARDVLVPVTIAQAGPTTTASGAFAIKRLAFKIGEGEWSDTSMVADDVQIKFKLSMSGVPPM